MSGAQQPGAPACRIPVVGLGASAGGLEALSGFLANVPRGSGLAFVVVQHLEPAHAGLLVELLGRAATMPVAELADGARIAPDHAYVLPPDRELSIADGIVRLEAAERAGGRQPIDACFAALARDQGADGVGVVLSGTGQDGTQGLAALREAGGMTAAQEPATAGATGMPGSAIAAGHAMLVASPEQLPGMILAALCRQPQAQAGGGAGGAGGDSALAEILQLLRAQTGHDFSTYKKSTLQRRIERRAGLRRRAGIADYAACLRAEPAEVKLLFGELLIGVTSFFRDPEVWEQLRAEVVPALLARHPEGGVLRAWVAGCASGEEAYSLAMAFCEALDHAPRGPVRTLQIFATDLDQEAIGHARRGLYPAACAAALGAERARRFFTAEGGGLRVGKDIRAMVIFAPHSLLADPPFTRLDLLTCRNLMIYLAPGVHDAILARFHYSLVPDGVLLLGSSESVGAATTLFAPLPGAGRFYRRRAAHLRPAPFAMTLGPAPALPTAPPSRSASPMNSRITSDLQGLSDQLLLRRFAAAAVLVNPAGDVLHSCGQTSRYLELPSGKANWNILAMARAGLGAALSEAFHDAMGQPAPVTVGAVHAHGEGAARAVDITVQLLEEPVALRGMVLVVFADVTSPGAPPAAASPGANRQGARLKSLEQALQATREELQLTREEMQTSREELTSTNEELQSTNEELTTAAEELRTMNEELTRARGAAELGLARYTDLFDSAPVGYLTLDRGGSIVQANRAGAELLGLDHDLQPGGRLALFVVEADRPACAACLERAFASGAQQLCELRLWREGAPPRVVRLTALAADDARSCRVVVADVTEVRHAESSVVEWKNRYEATIDASGQLLYDWDPATNQVSYAGDVVRILGFTLAEMAGGLAHWLTLIHAEDRAAFEAEVARVIATRTPFRMEYRVRRKDGAWLTVLDDGHFILDAAGRITRMVGFVADITARRAAERAIRESEERYRMLWETTSDAVLILDERGVIQYANPALRTILGHDPAAVIGQPMTLLQPERLRQPHRAGFARYLADGTKRLDWRAAQVPGLHRDGHEVPLEISFTHTRIDGQHRFAGFLRDITERQRTEDALRANEARVSAVLRSLSEGLVLMDLQGRVLLTNDAVQRVLGIPGTDPGDPKLEIRNRLVRGDGTPFPIADQPSTVALRTGCAVRDVEVGVPRPDGSYAWICSNAEVVRDRDGTALGVVASFFDITHRKLGEDRLRASEERYRRIVETANEGIWVVDAAARTTFVNPKMAAMLGYAPAEMLGRELGDFMDEEGRAITERNLERRRQGISEQHDFTFRRRDGSELWTLIATNPIHDAQGAYAGAMGMVTDISERRRLEDELRQAQKMEAVGRLAGGIAHDFNNQLTVIQGYGQLALKRAEDEVLAKHLRHIVTATEHSADLVRQLLGFSRKGRHALAAVDLHGLLTELQEVLGRSLDKRIRIELALRAEAAVVTGDRGLLQSAFLNLALNARDAMPDGGLLRFATSAVDLDAAQVARLGGGMACGRHLRVTVSDSGQGMSAEVQAHLFEPFFSTKAPGLGTGLGLASVYGTVKQHEGGIEVVSAAGRGTVFQVFLPVAAAPAPVGETSGAQVRAVPRAAARILLIEDEELVAALVEDTLRDLGHEVVGRRDGALGVEHFRGAWAETDLVILDMNMPVMSGPEAFAALRRIDPGARVLVVSGYSESGGVDALLGQGAVGFLAKPFRPELLAQRVAELLNAR